MTGAARSGRSRLVGLALAAALAVLPIAASVQASPASSVDSPEDLRLSRVFAEDSAREEQLDPLSALYRGKKADAGALSQLFTDGLDRRRLASARQALRELARID
ncbi:MAG: hypothetical protein ABIM50_09800, partial [Novosphingobium sp.]